MKEIQIPYVDFTAQGLEELHASLNSQGSTLQVDTLNWAEDFPYRPETTVHLGWNEQGILISFEVRGLDLRTLSPGDGNYVHTDSCVEFFMQRERGDAYKNFEFNAAGVCYAAHHTSPQEGELLRKDEFQSITRWATHLGEKHNLSDEMHAWTVSVCIPWQTMGYAEGEIPRQMWGNFYKCGDETAHPHFVSWAPIQEIQPAFHRPQFFGLLTFLPRI